MSTTTTTIAPAAPTQAFHLEDDSHEPILSAIFCIPNIINTVLRSFILISKIINDRLAGGLVLGMDVGVEVLTWAASTAAITLLWSVRYKWSSYVIALLPVVVMVVLIGVTIQHTITTSNTLKRLDHFDEQLRFVEKDRLQRVQAVQEKHRVLDEPHSQGESSGSVTMYQNEEQRLFMVENNLVTVLSDEAIREILKKI